MGTCNTNIQSINTRDSARRGMQDVHNMEMRVLQFCFCGIHNRGVTVLIQGILLRKRDA